jgi:2-(1,2-epoxy-1,2-dihydrophenyl)acetyl-CoA isomerase
MNGWNELEASDVLRLLRREAAVRVELRRPHALNAFNDRLAIELRDTLNRLAADDDVRCVVLTGTGRAFSAGADIKAGAEGDRGEATRRVLREQINPAVLAIREMPKPVVAAVNGPAVGIGCSLALACDLIVAAESSYLLLAFVNIGLVPDGGSSLFIPARAGFTRAAEMALLGEKVPAAKALEWNLVNRVVPDADFRAEVEALATRLADGPTRSYAGTKRQLNRWVYAGMDDQLALEADIQQEMAASGDFAEGVSAFVEKRGARFTGR